MPRYVLHALSWQQKPSAKRRANLGPPEQSGHHAFRFSQPQTHIDQVFTRECQVFTREGQAFTREGQVFTREGQVFTREGKVFTREGQEEGVSRARSSRTSATCEDGLDTGIVGGPRPRESRAGCGEAGLTRLPHAVYCGGHATACRFALGVGKGARSNQVSMSTTRRTLG